MLDSQSFDIISLRKVYEGSVTPKDVINEVYRRIDEASDPGIFIHLIDKEDVFISAEKLNNCDFNIKPLWGIPFVIKDNIDAAGILTTAGCLEFAYMPEENAVVVAQLLEAGALLIGKTNLDQFATGLVGMRTPFPVPKNALDPEIVPGGSSSGSAVAVARGLVSFSLGTDTAGSGRVPAALNGIVGLKPTLGILSNTGVVPACRTLDTISIFATNVVDAHEVLHVTAKYDDKDFYARELSVSPLTLPSKHFLVGVPDQNSRRFYGDANQEDSFQSSLDTLLLLGAEIRELDFTPFFKAAELLYQGPWVAERYSVVENLLKESPQALNPIFKKIVEEAESFSSADTFRGFYRLQELKKDTASILSQFDLLCVPSIPTFYTCDELKADPIGPNSNLGTYTNFVNLLDLCGIAVPVSPRKDGRPGSVTLIGACGKDSYIGAVAWLLQQRCRPPIGATTWELPAKFLPKKPSGPEEIEIAVVGAHMSGLPLNHQLTELGAIFLKRASTDSNYKLYRLSGSPPERPGLVRDPSGSSIELEIWTMPISKFGSFMKQIPSPLGIGTLTLETGETVKGFICEASEITEAEDITSFGGWRGFQSNLSTKLTESKELSYEKT